MFPSAFNTAAVMPRGFMSMLVFFGARIVNAPCLADEFVAPSLGACVVEPFGDGRPVVVAHPAHWAARGAEHIASAYRPEVP